MRFLAVGRDMVLMWFGRGTWAAALLSLLPVSVASADGGNLKANIQRVLQEKSCPGCNLAGADLNRVDLTGANLEGANLAGAKLYLATLVDANLRNANLQGAGFGGADLARADLRGANLTGAVLGGAYLAGAKMDGVIESRSYADQGLPTVQEDVYVAAPARGKHVPFTQEVSVGERRDLAEAPPAPTPVPSSSAPPKAVSAPQGRLKAALPSPSSSTVRPKNLPQIAEAQLGDTGLARSVPLETSSHANVAVASVVAVPQSEAVNDQTSAQKTDYQTVPEKSRRAVATHQERGGSKPPPVMANVVLPQSSPTGKHGGGENVEELLVPALPDPGVLSSSTASSRVMVGTIVEAGGKKAAVPVEARKASAVPAPSPEVEAQLARLRESKRCVGCQLAGADLQQARLGKADLERAVLRGAILRGADLQKANLKGADLRESDLRDADLRGADLYRANLAGAYLDGARLEGAALDLADMTGAHGVDQAMPAKKSE